MTPTRPQHNAPRPDVVTALAEALRRAKLGKPRVPATSLPCRASRPTIATVPTPAAPAHPDHEVVRRTRIAVAITLRDLHLYAVDAICVALSDCPPGGYSAHLRQLTLLTKRVQVMTVILDRVCGITWSRIAERRAWTPHEAEGVYAPMEAAWLAGSLTPWAPTVPGADALTGLMPIDLGSDAERDVLSYLHARDRPGVAR